MTITENDRRDVLTGDQRRRLERLCSAVEAHLEEFSDSVTDQVRTEVPSYVRVPLSEQREHVRALVRQVLRALGREASPTADELRFHQAAGRRRAYFGVPVQDVLATFHILSLRLWEELRAQSEGPEDAEAVIAILGSLGVWARAMSGAVAGAYTDEASMRHGREVSARHRLLEAIRSGGTMVEQAADLARELGFDPEGEFQAVCSPASAWPQEQIDLLQRGVSQRLGIVHCGRRGELMIALMQGADGMHVSARMAQLMGNDVPRGLGLPRDGLGGAEMSVADAVLALWVARTRGGGAASFADVWLTATLSRSRERLEPLLAHGRRTAAENPHLADAVRAFAESGFSVARAAEMLTVHPNTAAYRLARWRELTDWDPRTLSGLMLSIAALDLPASPGGPTD